MRHTFFILGMISFGMTWADEAPPKPRPQNWEEFFSKCNESGCRLYPFDPSRFKDENLSPPLYNAEDENCYNALPLSSWEKELPSFFTEVGKDKKHFFLPITQNPEKHLEPGDILVYFRNMDPQSKDLYRHVTKGRWHAAMVGKDKEGLFRLDSPPSMSGRNLSNGAYHILRLRPDTPNREEVLRNINEVLNLLKENGYSYDGERKTEVALLPKNKVLADLRAGKTMSLYCSELPTTACVLGELPLPKPISLLESVERVEEQIINPLVKNGEDRKTLIQRAMQAFFSDTALMRELGASELDINHYRDSGEFPEVVKKTKDLYEKLFLSSKEERRALLAVKSLLDQTKGPFVGPSDLFDNIFDSEGSFSYVGSFVGKSPSLGESPTLGGGHGGIGGGGDYQDLSAQPHGLFSEKLHVQGIINQMSLSPDGLYIATASHDHTVKILDLRSRKVIHTLRLGGLVRSVAFSPDGKKLGTGSWDRTARVFDLATGQEEKKFPHGDWVQSVVFSPDGKKLGTGSWEQIARVFDLATGQEEKKFQHENTVRSIAFSPDGKKLWTGSDDNPARVFDLATGQEEKKFLHRDSVWSIAFSPDGKKLGTGSWEQIARVFDLATGQEEKKFQHGGSVWSVAFSSDGKKLGTGSGDKTARVFDLATGQEEKKFPHGDSVWSVVFSPDSRLLFTADDSGGLHVFYEKPVTQEALEEELRAYDQDPFIGEAGRIKMFQRQLLLKLMFEKAKKYNSMTKEQAEKLMNISITRADYRGFFSGAERFTSGPNAHIYGLINEVFTLPPLPPVAGTPP